MGETVSPEAVPAWALILAGDDGVRLRSLTSQIVGGFILIMFGFLLQWPTLLTLAMFPVLVSMYVRLARAGQHVMLRGFGGEYAKYAARTPAFIPWLAASSPEAGLTATRRRP